MVDAPVVEEEVQVFAPAPSAAGPPRVKIIGEPRPRPEVADAEEPPAKRPALVVSKPVPAAKVPQKARPRIRGRLAQDVQEVEPDSYNVRERSPFRVCEAIGSLPFVSTPV